MVFCFEQEGFDGSTRGWTVPKSFLGNELQFCAEQTAVHSGENSSFVRRNFFKTPLFSVMDIRPKFSIVGASNPIAKLL